MVGQLQDCPIGFQKWITERVRLERPAISAGGGPRRQYAGSGQGAWHQSIHRSPASHRIGRADRPPLGEAPCNGLSTYRARRAPTSLCRARGRSDGGIRATVARVRQGPQWNSSCDLRLHACRSFSKFILDRYVSSALSEFAGRVGDHRPSSRSVKRRSRRCDPPRRATDELLIGRKIAKVPWAVYASHSYIERHGRPERPQDIEHHVVIAYDGEIADYSAARWLRSVAPRARVAARSENWPGYVLAVKSGAGLGPLPIHHGDRESELVRLIDTDPELVSHFWLLMHRDMRRTPRVRAFFDFFVAELKAFRTLLLRQAERPKREAETSKMGQAYKE